MSKAAKINKAIDWIAYAAGAYFVGTAIAGAIKKHREKNSGTNGIGYADTPNYSLSLLNRYIQSVPVTDVQVVLNDKNKYGHYYVLCGDVQGGRDFYLSGKNLPYFRAYCERRGIEYEEFYLPGDVISDIGAAERIKRRIYKEISLAQEAGIDLNKDYSLFTDEEIATLEELGHNASWEQKEQKPYAQAYYESLQKAYNAISGVGIGTAYDIKDANGNTVLTWIEDAAAHVAHERDIEEKRKRTLEAEERAAAARKQRNATKRKIQRGQMSLFGIGAPRTQDLLEPELLEFVRQRVDPRRMSIAFGQIDEMRCPLSMAEPTLYNDIMDLVDEWCVDNAIDPDSVWSVVDVEDIFWEL